MNALDDVKVPPAEMFDDYDTGGWTPPPQPKVIENGKLKAIQFEATMPGAEGFISRGKDGKLRKDKNGYFMLQVDGIRVGDYEIRSTYLSSAPFAKRDKAGNVIGTRNASNLGNFLRAHGLNVRPATAEEYIAYALHTAGRPCTVTLDWEAYNADTKQTIADKWEQFPDDPDNPGAKLPYIELEGGKRAWARAGIKRFVDQVGG